MREYHEALVRELDGKKNDLEKLKAELMRLNQQLEQHVRERTTELQAANVELEAANSELDVFNRTITHDLRSSLTEVYAYSQMLHVKQAAQPDAQAREFIGKIVLAAQRMEFLIKELDKLSRIKDNE